jgi:site-specific recombinase XerD
MKDELERSTLVNYHVALRDLEIFLEEKGKKIEELTFNDIKKYVDALFDRNYKKSALEKKFTALKSFFRFIERRARLREEKPIIKLPIIEESKIYFKKKLRQIKISESDRLPSLSEEEIQEIRRKLKGEIYLLSLFELDLNLGLRASEFGYIKANIGKFENVNEALEKDIWLDLRKDKGKMLLYRQKRKLYHLVALTDEMIELVKRQFLLRKLYRVNHNFLFFTITGKKVRENSIHESYRKLSKITGIKVTSHRLRRTMNTLMELKRIPKMVRRERLGHAPATQTDRYSIMGLDDRRIHLKTIGRL